MRWKIALAFLAVYSVWGMTYLAMRVAVRDIPPYLMSGARFLVAGLVLYLWARRRGDPARRAEMEGRRGGGRHFCCSAAMRRVAWAEQQVPSGLAAVLIAVVPIWMVGLEWAPRRPAAQQAGGRRACCSGWSGWDCWSLRAAHATGRWISLGAALLVLAVGLVGLGIGDLEVGAAPQVAVPCHQHGDDCRRGLCCWSRGPGRRDRAVHPADVSTDAMLAWLFLVIFGSLVGFTAYIWLLGVTSIAKAGTYAYVNPIVAVLLGWAILGEPVTGRTLVAAAGDSDRCGPGQYRVEPG